MYIVISVICLLHNSTVFEIEHVEVSINHVSITILSYLPFCRLQQEMLKPGLTVFYGLETRRYVI